MKLLTEIADYDEPGSWATASVGWPAITSDAAYDMFVFANCAPSIPYGSYVLISRKGQHGAAKSCLRVHPDRVTQLRNDFKAAGKPDAAESVRRRGDAYRARRWW